MNAVPGYKTTSKYGPREIIHLPDGGRTIPFHYGDDTTAPAGTPILSVYDGVVTRVGEDTDPDYEAIGVTRWPLLPQGWLYGGGYWIFINSGEVEVRYMHMQAPTHLKVGDRVRAGQQIGKVGSTGASTGAHLHRETIVDGIFTDPQKVKINDAAPIAAEKIGDEMVVIKLKNGRWYLVMPNGAGKPQAVWLPSKSEVSASGIPIIDFKNANAEQLRQLTGSIEGIKI